MSKDNSTPFDATEYDSKVFNTVPYYENFFSETIDFISNTLSFPKKWLDTGCGTGSLVKRAIDRFPNTQFILSDPSKDMLDLAQTRLAQYTNNVSYLEPCGTEEIGNANLSDLDVITAIQCHCYLDKNARRKAIHNCYNALCDGGILIYFENIDTRCDISRKIALNRWGQFQLANNRSLHDVTEHKKRFGTAYFPISIEDHLSLLKNSGFEAFDLLWYSHMQAGFFAIK